MACEEQDGMTLARVTVDVAGDEQRGGAVDRGPGAFGQSR